MVDALITVIVLSQVIVVQVGTNNHGHTVQQVVDALITVIVLSQVIVVQVGTNNHGHTVQQVVDALTVHRSVSGDCGSGWS